MKPVMFTLALVLAGPALADSHAMIGDAAAGEKDFKRCKACHTIADDSGEVLYKGGKTGPNLYNVIGRTAGTADYKYGKSLVEAGEKGLVWDSETIVAYITDPKAFLIEYNDDPKAKSKMTFKLKEGGEDIAAYLASVSPDAPEKAQEPASN